MWWLQLDIAGPDLRLMGRGIGGMGGKAGSPMAASAASPPPGPRAIVRHHIGALARKKALKNFKKEGFLRPRLHQQ